MKRLLILAPLLLGFACSQRDAVNEHSDSQRPNILLIVVDDMGFTDLGSFGGEIKTPNLDQLAMAGIRFTNFQSASTCSPARSMMLTGVDNHLAGLGNMREDLAPNQQGQPGYEGYLNDRVVTVATQLKDAGYRTMLSGKWHLGLDKDTAPSSRGFEQTFTLLRGGASHFADMRPAYAPTPDVKADYRENGVVLDELPDGFEYSTQFYVDRLIQFLDEPANGDAPFFAYLALTAPHWPLQAPAEAIDRHVGNYDDGYDRLLSARLERAIQMGVIPRNAHINPAPPKYLPWNELSDERKKIEARSMEIYAAMIDEVDRHSGRLFDYLRETGQFDNTVILFLSDNGAEGHDLDETWPAEMFPDIRRTIDTSHDFSYQAMGHPGSYVLYGANWARAASPASNLYKGFPTEGGTRVAAFAHYRGFVQEAVIDDLFSVKDVTPTLLALAGVAQHDGSYQGRAIEKVTGISQVDVLTGSNKGVDTADRVLAFELFGKRSVREGRWKLVHMPEPYGTDDWQLFNLDHDLAESIDVASSHPEIVARLLAEWDRYVEENNVVIPDWVSGY